MECMTLLPRAVLLTATKGVTQNTQFPVRSSPELISRVVLIESKRKSPPLMRETGCEKHRVQRVDCANKSPHVLCYPLVMFKYG